ncbi:MAG: hypothetical protein JW794_05125 [Candidatus Cloacimonetes bacterium]|nr:hypothetical protein [Candidatus Cloacimonadota bacterium]
MEKDKKIEHKKTHVPKPVRIILGILLGMLVGFLWHKFVGCRSGACPIASNYLYSLGFGGIAGLLISLF